MDHALQDVREGSGLIGSLALDGKVAIVTV
jgi:hypothetical protein